jgi:hypothetical protein
LRSSELAIFHRNAIPFNKFVEFLGEKNLGIPSHLLGNAKSHELSNSEFQKLMRVDLRQFTIPQLRDFFVRIYAMYRWKTGEGEGAKISATQLANSKEFKNAISYVDLKVNDPKKFAEKFSDLGPRSHKKKANSE